MFTFADKAQWQQKHPALFIVLIVVWIENMKYNEQSAMQTWIGKYV